MSLRKHRRRLAATSWALGATMLLALLSVGCSADQTGVESPVTEQEAREMAENALTAFNEADYVSWSRDWSDAMKAAIGEDAFLAFRDQFHSELGDYVAITEVSGAQGSDPGTYRWTFDVEFENGPYTMWLGFKEGSKLIEGVSFEESGT